MFYSKTYRMYYTILENVRSNWREFQALHSLGENVPLLPDLLGKSGPADADEKQDNDISTKSSTSVTTTPEIAGLSSSFLTYLTEKFNPSQYQAICSAAQSQGFSLIQGIF
jgi:hypothetical protein